MEVTGIHVVGTATGAILIAATATEVAVIVLPDLLPLPLDDDRLTEKHALFAVQ